MNFSTEERMAEAAQVVIIEDNNLISLIIKQIIHVYDSSVRVKIFEDGISALKYILDIVGKNLVLPELVFLDINIPGMSGLELLDMLKDLDNPILAELAIVIMSGTDSKQYIQQIEANTFVKGFLKKPFDQDSLLNYLDQYLVNDYTDQSLSV